MNDGRIFLWPKGSSKVAAVKEAVLSLNLPYSVKPFWFEAGVSEDAPRVLVLEDGFQWSPVVDYIRPMKKEQLAEAVKWALGLTESRGARESLDAMKRIFGEGLTMRIEKDGPEEEDEFDY